MGRSQRHKVMEQAVTSNEELWAQGVGTIPAATTHEMGIPRDAGVPDEVPPEGESVAVLQELTPANSPLVYGSRGGPLGGSLVQGPGSEGGTAPAPPDEGGGETEPPVEPEPAPTISQFNPDSVEVNTAIDVAVIGTGFTSASQLLANETPLLSDFVSETEITAHLPGFFQGGVLTIYVLNADQQMSNSLDFTVTETTPLTREDVRR